MHKPTIFIIRHGEKPAGDKQGVTLHGKKSDDSLIAEGWQRAGALIGFSKATPSAGMYSLASPPRSSPLAPMGTGQCNVKTYNRRLRDLIHVGKADPGIIVSHELTLDQAPDAYKQFDNCDEGWTKVILRPNG